MMKIQSFYSTLLHCLVSTPNTLSIHSANLRYQLLLQHILCAGLLGLSWLKMTAGNRYFRQRCREWDSRRYCGSKGWTWLNNVGYNCCGTSPVSSIGAINFSSLKVMSFTEIKYYLYFHWDWWRDTYHYTLVLYCILVRWYYYTLFTIHIYIYNSSP